MDTPPPSAAIPEPTPEEGSSSPAPKREAWDGFFRLRDDIKDTLQKCCELALKDHAIQDDFFHYGYRDLRVIKIEEETVLGATCSDGEKYGLCRSGLSFLTFEATGGSYGFTTFQAFLQIDIIRLQVVCVRTILPVVGIWYRGDLCLPLRSLQLSGIISPTVAWPEGEPIKPWRSPQPVELPGFNTKYNPIGEVGDDGEFVIDKMSDDMKDTLQKCCELALIDHVIQDEDNGSLNGLHVIKIERARLMSAEICPEIYSLIFQAIGETFRLTTFEAIVHHDIRTLKVKEVGTILPVKGIRYAGKLCVPPSSLKYTMDIVSPTAAIPEPTLDCPSSSFSSDIPEPTLGSPSSPPKVKNHSAWIGSYLAKVAEERAKHLATAKAGDVEASVSPKPLSRDGCTKKCGGRSNLEVDKLTDRSMDTLQKCCELAMIDYAIHIDHNLKGLRFIKIEQATALRVSGSSYGLTFQAATDGDHVVTFEATVYYALIMRKVIRYRTTKPSLGDWYAGKLCVPLI